MGLIGESFEDCGSRETELTLVTKRTFVEYEREDDLGKCRGMRGRSFTDSAIEYGTIDHCLSDSLISSTTAGSQEEIDASSISSESVCQDEVKSTAPSCMCQDEVEHVCPSYTYEANAEAK